jgi:LacI family transcriptional regulator
MAQRQRVTIQDIADQLGVSRGTVDRVLHGRGRVSAATRDRIREKADELGYVPNRSARLLALNRTLTIAVLRPERPRAFFDAIEKGIATAAAELGGYGLDVVEHTTGTHDLAAQEALLEATLAERVDAIALVPAHPFRLDPLIERADARGIPVVTFNTDAPNSGRLLFVGQDVYLSGEVAGELMARFLTSPMIRRRETDEGTPMRRVAMLAGFRELHAHAERLRGFRAGMVRYAPGVELAGPWEFHDDAGRAESIARELLRSDPRIAGFFSTSGDGHVGVGRALVDLGRAGSIQNIGYDLDEAIRELMHRDAIQASIGQDPFSQGYYAIKLLHRHLVDRSVPSDRVLHTRIDVIVQSNVDHASPESEVSYRAFHAAP